MGLRRTCSTRARELALRVGVDVEAHLLALAHAAHVGLVDRGVDPHPGQVVGDQEQHRRLERGGHGLAHVHVARDHDAVDRGRDDGVAQVHLGLVQVRLRLALRGLVGLELGDGAVVVGLGRLEVGRRAAASRPRAPGPARTSGACRRPRRGRARRWPGRRAGWPAPGRAGPRRATGRAARRPGPS